MVVRWGTLLPIYQKLNNAPQQYKVRVLSRFWIHFTASQLGVPLNQRKIGVLVEATLLLPLPGMQTMVEAYSMETLQLEVRSQLHLETQQETHHQQAQHRIHRQEILHQETQHRTHHQETQQV